MIEFTYDLAGIELHVQATVMPPSTGGWKEEPPEAYQAEIECVWVEKAGIPKTTGTCRSLCVENQPVDYDSLSHKGTGLEELLMDKAIEEYKREVEG